MGNFIINIKILVLLPCVLATLAQAQNVGLGVANPQARLDIQSANASILTGAGDLRIGGNSRFLKFGVNTSVGNSFILAQGGNGNLEIGAGSNTGVLNIRPTGAVGFSQQFGSSGQMLISRGSTQAPVWRRPPYMFIFRTNTMFQSVASNFLFVGISGIDEQSFTLNERSDVYFNMVNQLKPPLRPETASTLRITFEIWNSATNSKVLSTSNENNANDDNDNRPLLNGRQSTITGFIRLNAGSYQVYAYAKAFNTLSTDTWQMFHALNTQDNSAFMAFQIFPVYP